MVGRPRAGQILRERLRSLEQRVRKPAKIANEGELASGTHPRVTGKHLLDQRRARARKADHEHGLWELGAQCGARQQLQVRAHEKLLQPREKGLHRVGSVLEPAAVGRESSLALREIEPGFLVAAEPLIDSASLEPSITVERRRGIQDGQGIL